MSSKAKRKGKYLEELVAKLFQEHCNLTKFDVHRNQTSGVFQTEFGDVYFKDKDIIIECKNQESWDYRHVLTWKKPITDWWNQLLKDVNKFRETMKKEPLYFLVIGKSHYPKFAIASIPNLVENDEVKINFDIFVNHCNAYTIINDKEPKVVIELNEFINALSRFMKR